jgi:pyruvate/2-oxoglutarate dehydrogenase complex dihydrolipoamide acyltransferase (E2) component
MPAIVRLPRMSDQQERAKVVRWFVAEGEAVMAGAPLAEIEFGKATLEFDADVTGRLAVAIAPAGATVEVNAAIAAIALDGEDILSVRADAVATHPIVAITSPRSGFVSRLLGLRS